MVKKYDYKTVQKVVRYTANSVLLFAIFNGIANYYVYGIHFLKIAIFWLQTVALFQIVLMLMFVENFYVIKKKDRNF